MGRRRGNMNLKQVMATAIVGATLSLASAVATAQEGPYFSVFWGQSMVDVDKGDLDVLALDLGTEIGGSSTTGSSSVNDTDTAWGAQIGYRFNRFVAAEIGYVDLGKANYVGELSSVFPAPVNGRLNYEVHQRFLSSGPTIAALGIFPIGQRFEVYGRGGIYFADTRYRLKLEFPLLDEPISSEDKAGTQEFFGGLGFAWNINEDYAVRVEGSYFNDVGDDDRTGEASVALLTIGFVFR